MDRRALLVAASKYEDEQLDNLPAAKGDLEALTTVLKDADLGGFGVVDHAINEPKATLERRIEEWLSDAHRADFLLVYFSGHGIRRQDQEGPKLYLATSDTRHHLRSSAILARDIFDLMLECRCRQQLLLLDCCYSGQLISDLFGHKSAPEAVPDEFRHRILRERKTFGILTASLGRERAWSLEPMEFYNLPLRSAFTDAVVKGIWSGDADQDRDGRIGFDELFDYVDQRLASDGRQLPERLHSGGTMLIAGTRGKPLRPDDPRSSAAEPAPEKAVLSDALEPLLMRWPAPKLADVDPEWVGVTETPWWPQEPPYLPRPSVDSALQEALRGQQLVVAHGPPASGKSRSLHQAGREVLPGHRVLQPRSADALAQLVPQLTAPPLAGEPVVIWLTHLERFLVPGGLDVGLLARLGEAAPRVKVIATLADGQHLRLREHAGSAIVRPFVQVLASDLARLVKVPAGLEPAARRALRDHPYYRARKAPANLGPYAARHRELLRFWGRLQRDHEARAVVQAAADWHRMGMDQPPLEVYLRDLVPHYLDGSARPAMEADDQFEQALRRAADEPEVGVRLLRREPVGRHNAVLVSRFMIDLSEQEPIPGDCWRVVTDIARPWDALVVGFNAYTRGALEAARYAWEEAVKDDLPVGWLWLGQLALERSPGHVAGDEVLEPLRRAADAEDDPEVALEAARLLAETLRAAGRPAAEVSGAYRKVIDAGHPHWSPWARLHLGLYLQDRGDHPGAFSPLREAGHAGDPSVAGEAAYRLGVLVADHGDRLPLDPDARDRLVLQCLQDARESPDKAVAGEAAYRLGVLAADHGDRLPLQPDDRDRLVLACLEQARASAMPHLSGPAALRIGRFHLEQGRAGSARDTYQRARRCPDPAVAAEAAHRLAILALERPGALGLSPDSQGTLLLETLGQARGAADPATATDAAYRLAILAHERPGHLGLQPRDQAALLLDTLTQARRATDPATATDADHRLALLALERPDDLGLSRQQADRLAHDCLQSARRSPDPATATDAAHRLAILLLEGPDDLGLEPTEEGAQLLDALTQARRSPDPATVTDAAYRLAELALEHPGRLGLDRQRASRLARDCLEAARWSADPALSSRAILRLGLLMRDRGALMAARDLLDEARGAAQSEVAAEAAFALGELTLEHGDELGVPGRDQAQFGLVCFDHACRSPDQAIATAAAGRLGLLLLRQGERLELSQAERDRRIRACLEHARSSPDPYWAGTAGLELGRYLAARGGADRAERLLREASRSPAGQVAAQAAYELGKLLLEAQDRQQDAVDALTQAMAATSDLPRCQVSLLLGDAYLQLGRRLRGRQEPDGPDGSEAALTSAAERYRAARTDCPTPQRLRADRGLAAASVELAMTARSPEGARSHLQTALGLYEAIMRAHPGERAALWPDAARVRSRLAQVLAEDAEVRDIADAQAQYRRALGICLGAQDPPPGNPRVDARQLRRMLGAWLARLRHEEGAAGSGTAAPQRTEEFLHELAGAARHLDEAALLDLAQQLHSWGRQSRLQQGRLYVAAVGLCQRVGRGSDQEAAAWLLAGELLWTLGAGAGGDEQASLLERSRASLTRAVAAAREPQPDAEYLLGRLAERLRPLPEAVDHYLRAAGPWRAPRPGGDPNRRHEALWRIARLSERQRQWGPAMVAYTQLLSAPPPYAGPARRRRRLLWLVPLSARAPEPPLADTAANDARQLEEGLRTRQQRATDAGTVLLVGGVVAALGALELVAWLAATPLGSVPRIGPALLRSHEVLRRFALLDLAVGALWGAYGLLLMTRTAAMLSDRVRRLVVPTVLALGSLALQRGLGGLTRARLGAMPAVAWVAALLGLVAVAIWLVVARHRKRR